MILFLPESSTVFSYSMWQCDSVTVTCDVMLILNSCSQNKLKRKENQNQNKKVNKIKQSPIFATLTRSFE